MQVERDYKRKTYSMDTATDMYLNLINLKFASFYNSSRWPAILSSERPKLIYHIVCIKNC